MPASSASMAHQRSSYRVLRRVSMSGPPACNRAARHRHANLDQVTLAGTSQTPLRSVSVLPAVRRTRKVAGYRHRLAGLRRSGARDTRRDAKRTARPSPPRFILPPSPHVGQLDLAAPGGKAGLDAGTIAAHARAAGGRPQPPRPNSVARRVAASTAAMKAARAP